MREVREARMQLGGEGKGPGGRPRSGEDRFAALREELRPRVREIRHGSRLFRRSALTMVGLGIVLFFAVLSIIGPLIAPQPFTYNVLEKNAAPMVAPVVGQVGAARNVSGGGWIGTEFVGRADELLEPQNNIFGFYARSDRVGDRLVLGNFPFDRPVGRVLLVRVDIQYNSTPGAAGNRLDIEVTWDGGAHWSPGRPAPLRFSDSDMAWFQFDMTKETRWDAASLASSALGVALVHRLDPGFTEGGVGVDAVKVLVHSEGRVHVLGTTVSGEDVLSGILLGAPISMRIALVVVISSTLIGMLVGVVAGYLGGIVDEVVMRITDVFFAIPGLILALAVTAALGRGLDNVVLALIVTFWPTYARLVRGQTLAVRENLYIEAARAAGATERRIVLRHLLPNTLSPILVQSSLDLGTVVLVAAALGFLGIGAQPGTPEWGLMVSQGFNHFPPIGQNWWQVSFSGLMIFLFVLGFNLLGDGARDILDPRLRR